MTGVDLTPRAIEITRWRFEKLGLRNVLKLGDAENLDYPDNSFVIVYSWGMINHNPDTKKAVHEIFRVLKPGGVAKVLVYQKYSLVGFMLWLRYALLAGRPFTSLATIYAKNLECPGTKAYSEVEGRGLFRQFKNVSIMIQLGHEDLLTSQAGQHHEGALLNIARLIWSRWLLMRFCRYNGLFMLIEATKSPL